MGAVKEFFDGMISLIRLPVDLAIEVVNKIGVQRAGALLTITGYVYMTASGITVTPTYYAIMLALNGIQAGKSIHARGVIAGKNSQ